MTDLVNPFLVTLSVRPVLTRCARCPETFDGPVDAGAEWFRAHLAAKHPDVRVSLRTTRRPSLHAPGPLSLARQR